MIALKDSARHDPRPNNEPDQTRPGKERRLRLEVLGLLIEADLYPIDHEGLAGALLASGDLRPRTRGPRGRALTRRSAARR